MVQTSFEGPPDKPRNLYESLIVGLYLFGALLVGSVVTGLVWFGLETLHGFIGYWLLLGLPLTILSAVIVGYLWRHIDPEDPFSLRKVYRDNKWKVSRKRRELRARRKNYVKSLFEYEKPPVNPYEREW